MAGSEPTVIARTPLLLLQYAERHGIDRHELMHTAGLSDRKLADPDSRIPVATMRRLWHAVIVRSDDDYLGINVGQAIQIREMGLVGYAMYHSSDLRGALKNLSRYGRIVSEAVKLSLIDSGDKVVLQCHAHPFMIALRHPVEGMLSLVITAARDLTGTALVPSIVSLPSTRPKTEMAYTSLFGSAVSFDCSVAEMSFTQQQMGLPTQAPDTTLGGYLHELAESKLAALRNGSSDLVEQVRRAIWASLPDAKPNVQIIASQLTMSARTLQRRLREAGTSYSTVLEEFRREMSEELRCNRAFAAADVAFLLGYSESSAYQRAARRWRKMSGI